MSGNSTCDKRVLDASSAFPGELVLTTNDYYGPSTLEVKTFNLHYKLCSHVYCEFISSRYLSSNLGTSPIRLLYRSTRFSACPTSAQPHKPGRTSCAQARVYSGVSRRFLSDTLMSVLPTSSWFTHSSKPVRRQHQYVANSLHTPKTHSTHRQVTNSATRYGDSLGVSSSRTT